MFLSIFRCELILACKGLESKKKIGRQVIEIAGRAKPRPNQLGSVKTPNLSVVGIDNYSVKMKEYVLCVFPSLCGKQQTPDTISIKVEEDIGGGMPAVG